MHLALPCAVAGDKRAARRGFVSVWMLEFSVLWAVFPLLDQVLSGHVDYKRPRAVLGARRTIISSGASRCAWRSVERLRCLGANRLNSLDCRSNWYIVDAPKRPEPSRKSANVVT